MRLRRDLHAPAISRFTSQLPLKLIQHVQRVPLLAFCSVRNMVLIPVCLIRPLGDWRYTPQPNVIVLRSTSHEDVRVAAFGGGGIGGDGETANPVLMSLQGKRIFEFRILDRVDLYATVGTA